MPTQAEYDDLAARIAELEEKLEALQTRFDEIVNEEGAINTPQVHCRSLIVDTEAEDEDGNITSTQRITLGVDSDGQERTFFEMSDANGQAKYNIFADSDSVQANFFRDGWVALQSKVDSDRSAFHVFYPGGETYAWTFGLFGGGVSPLLQGFRNDGTLFANLQYSSDSAVAHLWIATRLPGYGISLAVSPKSANIRAGSCRLDGHTEGVFAGAGDRERTIGVEDFMGDTRVWASVDAGGNTTGEWPTESD